MQLKKIPRLSKLSKQEFEENFLNLQRPVVLTDLSKDWPAMKKWTPEFFKEKHGTNKVKVYSGDFINPGKEYMSKAKIMDFKDYLTAILDRGENLRMFLYNIVTQTPELKEDVHLPQVTDGFSKRFFFTFFGPKGATTQLHYDIDMSHVFHTPIRGKKTIILFSPEQSRNLYRHPFTVRSYVNIENPDYVKFPNLERCKGHIVTLEPGETLFIPSGYWHHVIYDDAGYAVAFRCKSQSYKLRLKGILNILFLQTTDRVFNKLGPLTWFKLKSKWAKRRAQHEMTRITAL